MTESEKDNKIEMELLDDDDDEEEDELIKFEDIEDIKHDDKLFEMSRVVDIKKLLSTNKRKHSKILVNKKYYIQVPNPLEQENVDEQGEFCIPHNDKQEVELIENEEKGTAQLVRLDEIYYMCTYFNLDRSIAAEIIRQHLSIKTVYAQEVRQLCYYKELVSIMKSATRYYIAKQFAKAQLLTVNQTNFRNSICDILLEFNQIYPSMSDIQFPLLDFNQIEHQIIHGYFNEPSKQLIEDFQMWKTYIQCPIITVNKTFYPRYDPPAQLAAMTGEQLQKLISSQINTLEYNKKEIDLSKMQEIEEQYLLISQRPLDYKEENKVVVEVRYENGIPFLASKSNNSYFIVNAFSKFLNSPESLNVEDNKEQLKALKDQVAQKANCKIFSFNVKDILQNIDYSLVEAMGYVKLAKYLKERRIVYKDTATDQEVLITANKGIYYGELFTPDTVAMICNIIAKFLTKDITTKLDNYTVKVYYTYTSFILLLTPKQKKEGTMEVENEDLFVNQEVLKLSQQILHNFSFEMSLPSFRAYSCDNKKVLLQKVNATNEFEHTNDLVILGRDVILNQEKIIEFTSQQVVHIDLLLEQFKQTKTKDLTSTHQDLVNYCNYRLVKRFLKYHKQADAQKKKLEELLKDIEDCLELPFYKNKVPFL